jgi:hypothetical protein
VQRLAERDPDAERDDERDGDDDAVPRGAAPGAPAAPDLGGARVLLGRHGS